MSKARTVECKVCGKPTHYRSIKQHLKLVHGYIYTEYSPDYPVPPKANGSKKEKL